MRRTKGPKKLLTRKRLTAAFGAAVCLLLPSLASAAPFLYGTAYLSNELFRFDLGTNTKTTIKNIWPETPDSIAFESPTSMIYTSITSAGWGTVNRLDLTTMVDQTLASWLVVPKDIVLEPGGKSVLVSEVADGGGHHLTRVELCAVPPCAKTNIPGPIGGLQLWAVANGPNGLAYVGNDLFVNVGDRFGGSNDSHLAQIDPITGAIIQQSSEFAVFGGPQTSYSLDGMTYDAVRDRLYVSSTGSGWVYEFNPHDLSIAPNILFANQGLYGPDGIVTDNNGHLYIASFSNYKLMECTFATGTCTQRGADIFGVDGVAFAPGGLLATDFDESAVAVPEPATLFLFASGLICGARRRRRPN